MFTFDDNVAALWEHHQQSTSWRVDVVNIEVQTSWQDTSLITINLMDTLEQVNAIKRKTTDDDFYWLPVEFNTNTDDFREKKLTPYFVRACIEAGFNLVAHGYDSKRTNSMRYRCNRGRFHKQSTPKDPEKVQDRITRTFRPIRGEDDNCKFGFQILWNQHKSRWCIPREQAGSRQHTGHTQREPHECRMYLKDLGQEAIQLIIDGLNSSIRPAQVTTLINATNKHQLNDQQIRNLRKKMRDSTVIRIDIIEQMTRGRNIDGTYTPTPADRLMSLLETSAQYSYTVLYANYDSDELKVYKRDKSIAGVANTTLVENPGQVYTDSTENIVTYTELVRKRLSITGSACILLAIAWTTSQCQRKFEMYPEFSCSDVTHGTNAERRPLLLFCGLDGNREAFTHTWAFLPNQSRWIFDWFFGYACAALHKASALQRNYVHITDQDMQELGAFEDSIGTVFINSRHRLCAFHKINRNFLTDTKYKPAIAKNNMEPVRDEEFGIIVLWLNKFIRNYETEEEASQSERCLEMFLDSEDCRLTQDLKVLTLEYFRNQFQPHRRRLYRYMFFDIPSFDHCTSSINEAENRSIKWSSTGPRACDGIDESVERIGSLQHERQMKRQRAAAIAMNSKPTKELHKETTLPDLTRYMSKVVAEEQSQSRNYQVHCVPVTETDKREYYVKRTVDTRKLARSSYVIPSFERTRIVRVFREHGTLVAVCSCKQYIRKQYCCRHVYACLSRGAEYTDAAVRYWNIYEYRYGGADKELTNLLRAIGIGTKLSGVRVSSEHLIKENIGQSNLSWFTVTLTKSRLHQNSYWYRRLLTNDYGAGQSMGPIGLVREVHLSDDFFLSGYDSDRSSLDRSGERTNLDRSGERTNMDRSGEQTDQDRSGIETTKLERGDLDPRNAWLLTHKTHNDICENIRTKEQLVNFIDLLTGFQHKLAMENSPSENANTETGLFSLPATQTKNFEPRRTRLLSPPKKRSRTGKGSGP